MAQTKITDLTAILSLGDDAVFYVVDTQNDTSHKITKAQLLEVLGIVAIETAVDLNTAKTGITTAQATAIVDNTDNLIDLTDTVDENTAAIILNTAKNSYPSADASKVGFLTITAGADLDQMQLDIAALANGMIYKGDWDASSGVFPGGGEAKTGWFYYVDTDGTVDGVEFKAGDNIVATTDNASSGTYVGNWSKHDQTDAVQSVAGLTGNISVSALLSALNVEAGAQVNPTDSEIVESVSADLGNEEWKKSSSTEVTISAFKLLVSGSSLVPDSFYKIIDATGSNLVLLVYATSVNTWNKNVQILNKDYDFAKFTIESNLPIVRAYDNIGFVARNTGGTWGLITTGSHTPKGVSAASNQGDGVRITFEKTDYNEVVSLVVGTDETYASNNIFIGSSVGTAFADLQLFRKDSIRGYVQSNGTAFSKFGDTGKFTIGSYASGLLTITHEDCELYVGNCSSGAEHYAFQVNGNFKSASSTVLSWVDGGTKYVSGTQNIGQRAIFERHFKRVFDNTQSAITNSNIWGDGLMMKKFS